ncbi:hypothetical protein ABGA94_09185, partial [Stenotrophomonas sp. 3diitr2024]
YLQRDRPTLLVSFGRSGSSPESVAAVERVRSDVDDARFLGENVEVTNINDDPRFNEYWQYYHGLTGRRGVTVAAAPMQCRRTSGSWARMWAKTSPMNHSIPSRFGGWRKPP